MVWWQVIILSVLSTLVVVAISDSSSALKQTLNAQMSLTFKRFREHTDKAYAAQASVRSALTAIAHLQDRLDNFYKKLEWMEIKLSNQAKPEPVVLHVHCSKSKSKPLLPKGPNEKEDPVVQHVIKAVQDKLKEVNQ